MNNGINNIKMELSEIKKLIITSLDNDSNPVEVSEALEHAGVSYDFSDSFEDGVFDKLFGKSIVPNREKEFVNNLSFIVNRVAITGIAAILILLISIFITEGGSFSLNSLVGLSDVYEEGMLCLLGGM